MNRFDCRISMIPPCLEIFNVVNFEPDFTFEWLRHDPILTFYTLLGQENSHSSKYAKPAIHDCLGVFLDERAVNLV